MQHVPKRSNLFQKMVTYIAEQLAPNGAQLQESAELPERGITGVVREVDTLLVVPVGLTSVRIAIESRDRSRKDDIQWVDDLIGKYALLSVDRVLAISSSGFSAAARQKAELHAIELLTPVDVTDTNWPERFQKLGVASFEGRLQFLEFALETNVPLPRKITSHDRVEVRKAEGDTEVGSVAELVSELFPTSLARAASHVREAFPATFRTLEDLSKNAVMEYSVPTAGISLLVDNATYAIEKVTFRFLVVAERTILPVRHQQLGSDALLSTAQLRDVQVTVAQTARAKIGKVFFQNTQVRHGTRGQNH